VHEGFAMNIDGYDFISEQDFVGYWGAQAKPSGDLYFYDEVRSLPIEHVWTVSEGEDLDEDGFNRDNNWYASPGIFAINALGYLITDRPWADDTHDAVWYLDDDDEAREERRKDFVALLDEG
jgi:hypothetical protein